MNTRILLLAVGVAALSSCSSVYKSGQTPDDVYFSPARPQADEYVDVKQDENKYQSYDEYQDSYRNDRFLRMSIGNPYYLNAYNLYDGFDWRYNSYSAFAYGGYGFNSPWNSYWAWNNYYNPYCTSPYIFYGSGGGKFNYSRPISKPIAFNPGSYINSGYKSARSYNGSYYNNSNINQRYNNSNNNRYNNNYYNSNNTSRNNSSYTPSNSSNNSTPTRSYTPSSSGSSSSGGGGGGGSVSRPGRGGR